MGAMLFYQLTTEANAVWSLILSAITAVGTVGACVISLVLAFDRNKPKLDCVFIWGAPNNYKPTLLVNNLCYRTIIISRIDVFYDRKLIVSFDYYKDCHIEEDAVIHPGLEKEIFLNNEDFKFSDLKEGTSSAAQIKKDFKIVVHTSSGNRFVSKQRYSDDDILKLYFCYGFFKTN